MQCIKNKAEIVDIKFLGTKQYQDSGYVDPNWVEVMYKCDNNHLFYTTMTVKEYNNNVNKLDTITELKNKIKELEDENERLKILNNNLPSAPVIAHQVEIINEK